MKCEPAKNIRSHVEKEIDDGIGRRKRTRKSNLTSHIKLNIQQTMEKE